MERLFVDTGAWIANANKGQEGHAQVKAALETWKGRLVTSTQVFQETVSTCLYRIGFDAAVKLGQAILGGAVVQVVRVTPDDEARAWALFQRRRDQRFSMVDCTSFVIMRRLGLTKVASTDDDFQKEGFEWIPFGAQHET